MFGSIIGIGFICGSVCSLLPHFFSSSFSLGNSFLSACKMLNLVAGDSQPIHLRILVTLAVTTGMRRGEMAGLEWKNIDLVNGFIDIKQTIPMYKDNEPVIKGPKNKKSVRKIAISPSIVEELKLYYSEWRKDRFKIADKWENGDFDFFSVIQMVNQYPLNG